MRAPVLLLGFVVLLGGCRKEGNQLPTVTRVDLGDLSRMFEDSSRPRDFEKVLSSVRVEPRRAQFSKKDLSSLVTLFMQMESLADAEGIAPVYLPATCDLYRALHDTYESHRGWQPIQFRAQKNERVELFSVCAFILAMESPK